MKYTNYKCPVCNNQFTEDDDVVVCPECGTPHHRECYIQNGNCANADKHGTNEPIEVEFVDVEDNDETITLNIGKKYILFEVGNYRIVSRLLEGEFFNYKNAIPSESTTKARVNLKLILDSVERTSLLITSKIKSPVRCIFDDNTIRISSATSLGAATDKIPASIEGKRLEIGFNNTYLTDCLRTVDVDEVKIELSSPVSPIIVKPVEGDNFIFLIIPMRLKNENIG